MVNEGGNLYDVLVGDGAGAGDMGVRLTRDMTEARFELSNRHTVTTIDLDKDEVRKFGEALVRLSAKMEHERDLMREED